MEHALWYALPALVAVVVSFELTPPVVRLALRIGAIYMLQNRSWSSVSRSSASSLRTAVCHYPSAANHQTIAINTWAECRRRARGVRSSTARLETREIGHQYMVGFTRRVILWGPPIVYIALIYDLSSKSNPVPVLTEQVWDKLLHVAEYSGLALLFARALLGEGVGCVASVFLAVAFTSAYGASDEWHQLFTPGRDSNIRDWFADAIGGAVGSVLYGAFVHVYPLLRPECPRRD